MITRTLASRLRNFLFNSPYYGDRPEAVGRSNPDKGVANISLKLLNVAATLGNV